MRVLFVFDFMIVEVLQLIDIANGAFDALLGLAPLLLVGIPFQQYQAFDDELQKNDPTK